MSEVNFIHANISAKPTKDELKKEIARLKKLKTDYKNKDAALKIILNSVYGVVGFEGFVCYNRDVAYSVTKQSQDMIQYTIKIFNDYFRNDWHKNKELHKKLKITNVKQFNEDIVNYADTDSVFLKFGKLIDSTNYKGDPVEFALDISNDKSFSGFLKKAFSDYVDKFFGLPKKPNGADAIRLEMEQVSHSVTFIAKKKYIKDVSFEKGMKFDTLKNIQIKGLELNQSSTPKFVRDKLKEVVEKLVETKAKISHKDLLVMLNSIKSEFFLTDIENICKIERISDYQKWVKNDTTAIEYEKGAKPNIKGASYYNYMLHKNADLKKKYELISGGERVHWYYCKGGLVNGFSYLTGQFPYEIAPEVNKKLQFEKVFLGPLNNIFKAIGIPELNHHLIIYSPITW